MSDCKAHAFNRWLIDLPNTVSFWSSESPKPEGLVLLKLSFLSWSELKVPHIGCLEGGVDEGGTAGILACSCRIEHRASHMLGKCSTT
jgi:hypothetical protein